MTATLTHTTTDRSELLAAALASAEEGWPTFPCHWPESGRCSCARPDCPSPAKHPLTAHGLHDASLDPARIREWWARWPLANVAVVTGSSSGLAVLDVDGNGRESLARLEFEHGPLPLTPCQRTGSGGLHFLFAHPGYGVKNSAGKLGPGLDVRGDGGYVLIAPSRNLSGPYVWQPAATRLARWPAWLNPPAAKHRLTSSPLLPPVAGGTPYGRAALAAEVEALRTTPEGSRNHRLNLAAFNLGQLVAAGQLEEADVRRELPAAALAVGLSPTEVARTMDSGLGSGMREPRDGTAKLRARLRRGQG